MITIRLLTPQQQQHFLDKDRSIQTATYIFPSMAKNIDHPRQQQQQRRRHHHPILKRENPIHPTTDNYDVVISKKDEAAPRTKGERMAPLLETIETGSMTAHWPFHIFKKIHHLPAINMSDSDENIDSCIVTAYFKLSSSKHHVEQYDQWMQNMLSMRDCMVIYCEADMVPKIIQYRTIVPTTTTILQNTNPTTTVTNRFGPTVIIEMTLTDLPISKYYSNLDASPLEFWSRQLQMDPERRLHKSYELFWIWLSKSWFVATGAVLQNHLFVNAKMNTTTIETWMWADIGSFRGTEYMNQQLIQQHHQIIPDNDTVLWMAHRTPNPPADPYWNRKLLKHEKKHFYHSGSQGIANSVTAWVNFHIHFVNTFDEYATKDLFIGEDQCVLQTTCLLHPKSCAYVPYNQVHDNKYFGLRHAIRYGTYNHSINNLTNHPFLLWRPPLQLPIE